MKILYVAYPLLPVSDASAGGAEQMLWMLEREMRRRGHDTTVAACAGSQVTGRLFATGEASTATPISLKNETASTKDVLELLKRETFDLFTTRVGVFSQQRKGVASRCWPLSFAA